MKGYRINQAQINRIRDLSTDPEVLRIIDSVVLLNNPYSVVQRQSENRTWPTDVTARDVREGTYP